MSEFKEEISAETGELKEAVKTVLTESDRDRKEEIIENLPADLAIYLRGYLANAHFEARSPLSKEQERGIVAGEVFESLIRGDRELFGAETPAAAELREVLHRPERFSRTLDKALGHMRTPDLAKVNDKGQIVGFAEAKLGLLDGRAFAQLSSDGSLASLRIATRFLRENYNSLPDWGLQELSSRPKSEIKVAPECERVLVVPSDRDVSNPSSLIKSDARTPDFEALLRDEVTVIKSPFSLAEVWAIADLVLGRI